MTLGPRQVISPGPRAPTSFPCSSRKRISVFATGAPDALRERLVSRVPLCTQGPESSVQPYAKYGVSGVVNQSLESEQGRRRVVPPPAHEVGGEIQQDVLWHRATLGKACFSFTASSGCIPSRSALTRRWKSRVVLPSLVGCALTCKGAAEQLKYSKRG